ncbi:hypothetical protein CGLO_03354 [Colletotrichum gloeosporioides Cg-14]|uniref:Secreted protein n=1 Tax=Colletotrichum gloeosporioides (strain Cg-14) TaxID=1237896 RepID=T0KVS6_COLGC|nr:hypothetical protein CGLO_03354 [Colletotrichum gloeosporioides Cg-14]
MSIISSARSFFRPVVLLLIVLFLVLTYNHGSSRDTQSNMSEETNINVLSKLSIRIRQSSTSPPTVTFSVTNEHTTPLTILRWATPLDPLALQLGVLSVTPDGADAPLEIDTVALKRVMPPRDEDMVTLQPGDTTENEVILRDTVLPFDRLGKKPRVAAKGTWQTVWPTMADKLSKDTLMQLQFGDGVLSGEFETEAIEVTVA